MCQWGERGRLYTYVITLDGEWRFSETGPEFAIDMLSKHSMHSDVAPEIAFSGEFFVQHLGAKEDEAHSRLTTESHAAEGDASAAEGIPSETTSADGSNKAGSSGSPPKKRGRNAKLKPRDPADYELVIDNDSGKISI